MEINHELIWKSVKEDGNSLCAEGYSVTIHCKIRHSQDFSALHFGFQEIDHQAKELSIICGDIVNLKDM